MSEQSVVISLHLGCTRESILARFKVIFDRACFNLVAIFSRADSSDKPARSISRKGIDSCHVGAASHTNYEW